MFTALDDFYVTDLLIVGGGLAGCIAAIEACNHTNNVLLAVNGKIGRSGCTPLAGGPGGADFMVDSRSIANYLHLDGLGPEKPDLRDSPQGFKEDILSEGEYINNQKMVAVYVSSAPSVMQNLIDMGLKVNAITSAHGSRYPRGVIAFNKDIAGTMRRNVMVNPITVLEDFRVIDLLTAKNRCIGGIGIDVKSGEIISILSKAVVIATGGWQTAYHTGGSDELAGDGQAMAFRAGVELIDMEMSTFMDRYLIQPPFASRDNFVWNWNISREITNSLNEKILSEKHEKTDPFKKLELLSKEITFNRSSEEAGLSLKNPRKTLRNGYFHLKDIFTEQDYTDFNFEITIGCHYCSGGIRVNEKTETNLKGLYVAGEASGGLFGARRIASALTEAAVQGTLAGRNSIDCCETSIVKPKKEAILKIIDRIEKPLKNKDGIKPSAVFSKMKKLSSKYLTLYRTEALLKTVVANLSKMNSEFLDNLCCSYDGRAYNKEWMDSLSLTNLTLCLEATAKSALLRRETRGFHRRIDYPGRNDREWLKNIIIKNVASETCAEAIPIVSI